MKRHFRKTGANLPRRKREQIRKIQGAGTEGEKAFADGKELSENPYKKGTIEAMNWRLGWNRANHRHKKELEKDEPTT